MLGVSRRPRVGALVRAVGRGHSVLLSEVTLRRSFDRIIRSGLVLGQLDSIGSGILRRSVVVEIGGERAI